MNFFDLKQHCFAEMFVHDFAKKKDNPYVIAFRSHIWLVDANTSPTKLKTIYKTILKEHPQKKQIKDYESYEKYHQWDAYNLASWIGETLVDALVGELYKGHLTKFRSHANITTSPLAKKVAKQLNVSMSQSDSDSATGEDDDEEFIDRHDKTPAIPDVMYHGTTTKYIENILKVGLKPGEAESNWLAQGIKNPERVFLAASPTASKFHSVNASNRYDPRNYKRIQVGYPILLQVKVPDKAKIDPDYDADTFATGKKYSGNQGTKQGYSSVNSLKTSKHMGLFGYKGRIPASFIQKIWFFHSGEDGGSDQWIELNIPNLKRGLDEWGDEIWYYGGQAPEMDDWEDEDES